MKRIQTRLQDLVLLEPDVYGDQRGFFMETWSTRRYADYGIDLDMVQDNLSRSGKGVLRGLHFQNPCGQGKLVQVIEGEVFDVAVDIRQNSPTFGEWEAVYLNSDNRQQLYIPPGFAHGFCVTSESALFSYKCTDYYTPEHDHSVLWNDSDIGIKWPVEAPALSEKDRVAPRLTEVPTSELPQ